MNFDSQIENLDTVASPTYIFYSVTLVLIIIFALYKTGTFKELPCGAKLHEAIGRNFIHLEITHIAANLYTFYILSRIEKTHGSGNFLILITTITLVISLLDYFLKLNGSKCAIGFSGVLFGLAAWELTSREMKFTWPLIVGLVAMVITPSISNPRASLIGHALGAGVGVVAGLVTRQIRKMRKVGEQEK